MTPITCLLRPAARSAAQLVGILLCDAGVLPGQEQLLQALWAHGDLRQTELADACGLDPSTVTKSLQRLERAGLVHRAPAVDDRRVMVVATTETGEALRDVVQAAIAEADRLALEGLTEAEKEMLKRLLGRVQDNLVRAGVERALPGGC
ncbi:MarR family transcriptional regulator [Longispora fulva]|uniref:MarR family winged helix-turn-helix transcriptional regulator n=1 Tax=Longispora fulva TaxID=619741 RepID=UPI001A5111A8|nr:MarR family transcriptional regulator [Longispora fulva]